MMLTVRKPRIMIVADNYRQAEQFIMELIDMTELVRKDLNNVETENEVFIMKSKSSNLSSLRGYRDIKEICIIGHLPYSLEMRNELLWSVHFDKERLKYFVRW